MSIRAYPNRDGGYNLVGEHDGETFRARERIKAADGRWSPERKRWTVTDEQRAVLGYERMVGCWVRDTGCGGEDRLILPESEAVAGRTHQGFCARCDSFSTIEILEVLG